MRWAAASRPRSLWAKRTLTPFACDPWTDPSVSHYSLSLSRPAADRVALFSPQEQREVRRLLEVIRIDPSIDNVHKIVFPMPPAVFTAYVTSQFWIVYHVMGTAIRVTSIWRIADNGAEFC